ncbi:MAG: SpoIIE family protein phosphatase [Planctomycetota bacterium]
MTGRATVLVVDDEPGMVRTVTRILEGSNRILSAASTDEAVARLGAGGVDLALVDVRMPQPDGFALLERIRREWPSTDVIMMTGSIAETDQKLVQAIEAGAFYFITKPFERAVLLALVQRCMQLRRLDQERQQRLRQLSRELELARTFQQSLLPPPMLRAGEHTVWSTVRPAVDLSGDFVDHGVLESGAPWVFVGDVCGHGAAAAMVTGIVKAALSGTLGAGQSPEAAALALRAAARPLPADMFFTHFLAWIEGDELHYVNAGHPAGLLRVAGLLRELERTEPLASPSLLESAARPAIVPFPSGSRLLLYSDGLSEARDPDGAFFGIERLRQVLAESAVENVLERVLAAVDSFARGRPADDDHALLLLARQ